MYTHTHIHTIDWYEWGTGRKYTCTCGKKKGCVSIEASWKESQFWLLGQLRDDSQSCDTVFNSLLYGGTAVGLSSHSCSAALLQLSLRNCCRCFCCINLSYPPRKLSNKTIQRGPQRVQNSNIKWQGSEIFLGGESMTCFLANLCGWETERMLKTYTKLQNLIWQCSRSSAYKEMLWLQ